MVLTVDVDVAVLLRPEPLRLPFTVAVPRRTSNGLRNEADVEAADLLYDEFAVLYDVLAVLLTVPVLTAEPACTYLFPELMPPTGLKLPTAVVLPLFTDTAVPVLDTLVAVAVSEDAFRAVTVLPLTTEIAGLAVEETALSVVLTLLADVA